MAEPGSNIRINGERLWDSLMEMAKVGPGVKGGNNRLALTDVDREGRDLFKSWCEAAGCTRRRRYGGQHVRTAPGHGSDCCRR